MSILLSRLDSLKPVSEIQPPHRSPPRHGEMMAHRTPATLVIRPRNLTFAGVAPRSRWWLDGDPVATAFYNALSATFPLGERFFMESVRHFQSAAPAVLEAQIAAFSTQEATHAREHVFFNAQVAAHGYDLAAMEARTQVRIDFARRFPPLAQLGATVALEHFTAVLAHCLLADRRHLRGASDETAAMWRWHAIEEIEHKAVAFDTFMAASLELPSWRRWAVRVATMAIATWLLFSGVVGNMADMFTIDKINRSATWKRLLGFLAVRPGILRQALPGYLSYFLPGFHPWACDDRGMVAEAEQSLSAAYGVGAAT
jgi:predicted metal-dependent hydrolase